MCDDERKRLVLGNKKEKRSFLSPKTSVERIPRTLYQRLHLIVLLYIYVSKNNILAIFQQYSRHIATKTYSRRRETGNKTNLVSHTYKGENDVIIIITYLYLTDLLFRERTPNLDPQNLPSLSLSLSLSLRIQYRVQYNVRRHFSLFFLRSFCKRVFVPLGNFFFLPSENLFWIRWEIAQREAFLDHR